MLINENLLFNNKLSINETKNNLLTNNNLLFNNELLINETKNNLLTNKNLLFFSINNELLTIDELHTNNELFSFKKIKFRLRNSLIYYIFEKKDRLYILKAIKQKKFRIIYNFNNYNNFYRVYN